MVSLHEALDYHHSRFVGTPHRLLSSPALHYYYSLSPTILRHVAVTGEGEKKEQEELARTDRQV